MTGLIHGGRSLNLSKLSEWPEFTRHEALHSVLANFVLSRDKTLTVGVLSLEDRLLHYSISRIIEMRPGNYACIIDRLNSGHSVSLEKFRVLPP